MADGLHLVRVRGEVGSSGKYGHERVDDGTAADCDVGVQAAHRLQTPCVHPRLLEGLPARRGPQVTIGRVDAATWERHLVGVGA